MFEVTVIFIEEIVTKNGVKEKKIRRNYLVTECDTVSVAEAKIHEYLKDSAYPFEVTIAKESKIVGVV
tara:strand:- start:1030 stop:1233 length:204 start_codon:yes stop_codon:yes gene_type:complete